MSPCFPAFIAGAVTCGIVRFILDIYSGYYRGDH